MDPEPTPSTPGKRGRQRVQCKANSKQAGRQCRNWALPGQDVCKMHGGKSPQALAKAEQRLAERHARKALATYGAPVAVEPLEALLGELHRTAGHVAWLGAIVAGLDQDSDLVQRTIGGDQPVVWLRLYQQERAHLTRVAADCLKAGVEERRVRLAEQQGELIAGLIGRVLQGVGVDPADEGVRQVVHRELLALAAA